MAHYTSRNKRNVLSNIIKSQYKKSKIQNACYKQINKKQIKIFI